MRAHCDYNPYYDMLETIVNTWFETIYPNAYRYSAVMIIIVYSYINI